MNKLGKGIKDFNDIIGKEFGNLTPTEYLYSNINKDNTKDHYYMCICTCGNNLEVKRRNLKKKEVLSCGCLKRQRNLERIEEFKVNGDYIRNFNNLYYHANNNAKLRGYTFNIKKEDYIKLIQSNCHYCGVEPSNLNRSKYSHKELKYNGLDRKDNSVGYELDNVVPCCIICNKGKSTISYNEFKSYLKRVAKFLADSEDI